MYVSKIADEVLENLKIYKLIKERLEQQFRRAERIAKIRNIHK
jgi:hypothetical protein